MMNGSIYAGVLEIVPGGLSHSKVYEFVMNTHFPGS